MSIQSTLNKAYGIVGKQLGTEFNVYRPCWLSEPISDENWIAKKKVAFSVDPTFNSPHKFGVSLWLCWIDGNLDKKFDIEQGDVLYNPDTEETYFVASAQDHLYRQAIKANTTLQFTRATQTTYGDSGSGLLPTGSGTAVISSLVPAWVMNTSSGGNDSGYIPGSSYARESVPTFEIYIWDPVKEVKIGDQVTDADGFVSQVIRVERNELGTKLITQSYTAE